MSTLDNATLNKGLRQHPTKIMPDLALFATIAVISLPVPCLSELDLGLSPVPCPSELVLGLSPVPCSLGLVLGCPLFLVRPKAWTLMLRGVKTLEPFAQNKGCRGQKYDP